MFGIRLGKRLVLAASIMFTVAMASPVRADAVTADESAPKPEYEAVLAQALAFHAQGDYASARASMEQAHALEPSARTLRGLGIVAFAQGQHLAALRFLDGALVSEVKALPAELRTSVEQLREQIWLKVGRYEILVEPETGELTIDGAAPDFYAPKVVVLEPGARTIAARAEGRADFTMQLEAKAGARETLRIVLGAAPAPIVVEKLVQAEPALATGPTAAPRDAPVPRFTPAWRYAALGTGTALVLGGGIVWLTARTRLDQVSEACEEMAIGACTRTDARRRYNDKHIGGLVVTSALLTGTGAALLVSVAALELYRYRQSKPTLQALVGPSSFAVRGEF